MLWGRGRDQRGLPQYAASEIAADEIAAKNWPPVQRADIVNRRLAFRRHQFTPTLQNEAYSLHHCQHFANKAEN